MDIHINCTIIVTTHLRTTRSQHLSSEPCEKLAPSNVTAAVLASYWHFFSLSFLNTQQKQTNNSMPNTDTRESGSPEQGETKHEDVQGAQMSPSQRLSKEVDVPKKQKKKRYRTLKIKVEEETKKKIKKKKKGYKAFLKDAMKRKRPVSKVQQALADRLLEGKCVAQKHSKI